MLRIALLVLVLPLGACQLALPVAATQVALPLASSQTVMRGTKQMVEVQTEPPGATVSIAGYPERTTPTFIMLARGHSHTVRITKEGFKPVTVTVTSQRSDADVNATVLSTALDDATGAAWELCPNRLSVALESTASPAGTVVATSILPPPIAPAATPKTSPVLTTPPIAQAPRPSTASSAAAVLIEQIARLDKLLEQGVLTRREHELLTAAALSAAAIAGANASP